MRNIVGVIQVGLIAYKNRERIRGVMGSDSHKRRDFSYQAQESDGVLSRMFKAVKNGTYKIPFKTVLYVVGGVLYFLSPIDLIPDFFLGIGFIDDFTVIGLVVKKIFKEIKEFKNWENAQKVKLAVIKI